MFKVLIGKQAKGGTTKQQECAVELAALDLENKLNDPENLVESINTGFVHDINPLYTEVIAIVTTADKPTKKEK